MIVMWLPNLVAEEPGDEFELHDLVFTQKHGVQQMVVRRLVQPVDQDQEEEEEEEEEEEDQEEDQEEEDQEEEEEEEEEKKRH